MNVLAQLKIGSRLALLLGALLSLMVAIALSGVWGQQRLFSKSEHALSQHVRLAQWSAEIEALVLQERRYEKDSFINLADAAARDDYIAKWTAVRGKVAQALDKLGGLELEPEDRTVLASMKEHFEAYALGFEATVAALRDGRISSTQDANRDIARVKSSVQGLEKASATLSEHATSRADAVLPDIEALRNQTIAAQLGLSVAGLLAALLAGWLVSRSITRPLAAAVKVAEAVAAGDLRSRFDLQGRDETQQLMSALARMNASLLRIVTDVREASESIAAGTSEIAKGNADLSRRTEQQAASLQETAASMDELTATVGHNNHNARQATGFADEASSVARQGGQAVAQVVQTMEAISASSRKIGDIIGVIDGIAFQTNILALNAAVEAARAGEQGRGFAVVAAEVRNLAQRSADAAREIKSLIGNSVGSVEAGSQQVSDAGRTMTDIVTQVERVTALVREISGASQEQATGIAQVGTAVSQLDQVTQQNAALVEQSAAAAQSLNQQAQRLTGAVAVFQLDAN